ncbi:MAG: spore coat protein CotH [Lachnospiraceae bacterium]|nr:spore coat protein CotH [Lachnospiraceae bacterium]
MKYKVIGLCMVCVIIYASILATPAEIREKKGRVHQHMVSGYDTGCDCDGSTLCTHLPLVIMDTGGQIIPGTPLFNQRDAFGQAIYSDAPDGQNTIQVNLSVIDQENRNNHPTDLPVFTTACRTHIRGNSSRRFPKHSYALKFLDKSGNANPQKVMGMSSHHEWVLNGPILDKTLIRNYMWYNISGEIMNYAPNVRFCELILNGEYQGIYLMTEEISEGEEGRLHLKMDVKNHRKTGYLLRIDRPTEEEYESVRDIYTYNERMLNIGTDVAIRYPGRQTLTPQLAKDIELDYSAFEKALFSFDYNTDEYAYWNYIDVDNFIDYYLINEFTGNSDACKYSTYIYKEVGEKYRLCVWDFNNSCDNYQERKTSIHGFGAVGQAWFFMLFKDEAFVEKVIERYRQLRESYLSEEYLVKYMDDTIAYLGPALERNNARWAREIEEWKPLLPKERNVQSYEEAVKKMKRWLIKRGQWMDRHIDSLRQYGHPSRNKVYNH